MLLHSLDRLLSGYGAGVVGVVVALEAMGLPLPGESMVIAGALYCATTHRLSIGWVLLAAIIGAVVGAGAGYVIGRSLGFRLLAKHGSRVGLSADRLDLGRYLFDRYGGVVVFAGRFVVVLRTFVALLAGANRMGWARFLLWNVLGGVCWAGGYGLTAYYLGVEIMRLQGWAGAMAGTVGLILAVLFFVYLKRNERRLTEDARLHARARRTV